MTNTFQDLLGSAREAVRNDNSTNYEWSPEEAKIKTLGNVLRITGYIAGRRNALSSDINEEQAKVEFDRAKEELLQNGKQSAFITKVKANGEPMESQMEIKNDTAYTKTGLRSMDFEAYERCAKGYYKINLKEARPEYIAAELTSRAGKSVDDLNTDENEASVHRAAKAISDNGQFILIKEAELVKTLLEHDTKYIDAVNEGAAVGKAIPYMKQSKRNEERFTIKFNYIDTNKNPVKGGIGHLGLPYAVNRDYVGEVPADIVEVTNAQKAKDVFPGINVTAVGLTKEFVKYEEGPTMRVREEIPYAEYATEYAKMGVSEEMLTAIRGNSKKKVDAVTIDDMYTKSRQAYEMYKTIK